MRLGSVAVLVLLLGTAGFGCSDSESGSGSPAPRFVACVDSLTGQADGTVADLETDLLWERKTGDFSPGPPRVIEVCTVDPCPPPSHDVNYQYEISTPAGFLKGNVKPFLLSLNGVLQVECVDPVPPDLEVPPCPTPPPPFAGHMDWRLPTVSELQSIMVGPGVTKMVSEDPLAGNNPTGQSDILCQADAPCIDAEFTAVGGATAPSNYWSKTPRKNPFVFAWVAKFSNGDVTFADLEVGAFVRAVRVGECTP